MVKTKKIIAALLLVYLLMPVVAFATTNMENLLNEAAGPQGAGYDVSQNPNLGPARIVAIVIRTALGLIGVVFVCLIIYAGYLWLTAAGNEDRVSKAKKIMTAAVIGVAIVMFAYLITIFVFWRLAGIFIGNANEGIFGPLNF